MLRRAALALPLLAAMAGCVDSREKIAPRSPEEALGRVNQNLGQIDAPLQYKALVSFRFRDANGKDRRFIGHEAALVFAPPQYLRFDIRSLAGVVAQFGSNDEHYWIWIEPEVQKLWFGQWDRFDDDAASRLAVAPNDLLDVLMLRPLQATLAGGLEPVLRRVGDDQRLLFVRLGADGQPSGWREVRLDPYEPYQPLEIVDRLPDGRVQMHAYLDKYRPVGKEGPCTARKYVVYWPLEESEMRLDVTKAVCRPDLPLEVFAFPSEWEGAVEQIDAASSP